MTLTAMAQTLGITRQAIRSRMLSGWTWTEACSLPRGDLPERLRMEREASAVGTSIKASGLHRSTYYKRRHAGLTHEEALREPRRPGKAWVKR